jgi:phosphoglucosamine mutase
VCRVFDALPQMLRSVRFNGASPLGRDDVRAAIAAAEARLAGAGRVLIRESGTEPVVRVMAEAQDAETVRDVIDELCHMIATARAPAAAA